MFRDVKEIVRNDRHFNKENLIMDLDGKDINSVIEMYRKRIKGWYIDPPSILLHKIFQSTGDFILINVCCIIIDMLSQYEFNLAKSNGIIFQTFLKKYIKDFDVTLDPDKKLKYYHVFDKVFIDDFVKNINVQKKQKKDLAWIFYLAFRNGIIHNGLVLGFGRHNRSKSSNIIFIDKWGTNNEYLEITINPELLFNRIKEVIDEYLDKVKRSKILKIRFQSKFYRDFGWKSTTINPFRPRKI